MAALPGNSRPARASRVLAGRRAYEIGFWIAYVALTDLVNATSVLIEYGRIGHDLATWEPFVWEFSSGLLILLLIPLILRFDHRFPLDRPGWRAHLALHALATVPYSLLHVAGMVALRKLVYAIAGRVYDFGNVPVELLYEYRKDFLTYAFILAVVYAYRLYRRRRDGEASFAPGAQPRRRADTLATAERFLVRRRGREFVIRADDIDRVEACGNYVNLKVGTASYLLRESMKGIERRLDSRGFARVHRSHIVNLDRVAEIRALDSGDYRIVMPDGSEVGFSRQYRARLKAQLGT